MNDRDDQTGQRLDPNHEDAYRRALQALTNSNVPYMVAGAFALHHYTGIWRNTKDLDLFCRPEVADHALRVLADDGFETTVVERHWLGKAWLHGALVDLIWGGGNWATQVDQHWLEHAKPGSLLGVSCMFAPAEDIILSKAYVAGRERFDGADISHLIHACGRQFDWDHLVERFGDHWPLLLHYMVLYRFVYPEDRELAPARIIHELAERMGTPDETSDGLPFRGPLLDRYGYFHDLDIGRPDPRVAMAERGGHDPDAVELRRDLDREALLSGKVFGH